LVPLPAIPVAVNPPGTLFNTVKRPWLTSNDTTMLPAAESTSVTRTALLPSPNVVSSGTVKLAGTWTTGGSFTAVMTKLAVCATVTSSPVDVPRSTMVTVRLAGPLKSWLPWKVTALAASNVVLICWSVPTSLRLLVPLPVTVTPGTAPARVKNPTGEVRVTSKIAPLPISTSVTVMPTVAGVSSAIEAGTWMPSTGASFTGLIVTATVA
jgi:hypothetical protein